VHKKRGKAEVATDTGRRMCLRTSLASLSGTGQVKARSGAIRAMGERESIPTWSYRTSLKGIPLTR